MNKATQVLSGLLLFGLAACAPAVTPNSSDSVSETETQVAFVETVAHLAGSAPAPTPMPSATPPAPSVTPTAIPPASTPAQEEQPGPRAMADMVFHEGLGMVVMLNGSRTDARLWGWDGTRWHIVGEGGPNKRELGGVAYDPERGKLVVYGGRAINNGPCQYDTWEWDDQGWQQLDVPSPAVCSHFVMEYDAALKKVILFGGGDHQLNTYSEIRRGCHLRYSVGEHCGVEVIKEKLMRRIVSILCAVCMLVACAPAVTPAPGNFISATKTQAAFQKTQTFLCCTAVPKLSPTAVSDIATPPAPTVTPSQRPLTLGPDVTHYRGNSQRTGAYDFPAIRTLPALIWQKRFGSNTLLSAPIVAEDMLYVGVQRGGQLYALNPDTGDELWSVPTGEMPSHVAVAGDLVVVNDMRGRTLGIHRQRGTQLWSFATSGSPWGAPLILDEAVYIVSERGAYALEARTGQIIWQKNTGSHRGFVGSPAFAEGRLYFGVGPAFYALDALTGEEQWKVQRETWFYGTAVANGLIYVGNDDGYLYALDQSTGEEIWKSNVAGMGWSAPAIANDVVFVGNIDQHIYALDAHSGAELWKTEVEDWASADPVVSDGVVYVGNGNHEMREGQRHLYALDAQTGAELWKFLADARLLMAPALSTDKIYIVTTLGTLYALEAKPATSTVTAIHHGEGGRAGDAHVGPHSSVPGV